MEWIPPSVSLVLTGQLLRVLSTGGVMNVPGPRLRDVYTRVGALRGCKAPRCNITECEMQQHRMPKALRCEELRLEEAVAKSVNYSVIEYQ